jgi:hypothetical protein
MPSRFQLCLSASLMAALLSGGAAAGEPPMAPPLCSGPLAATPRDSAPQPPTPPALVFENRPLADVAVELSRLGPRAVRTDPSSAKLRFSGVLMVADQESMVTRVARLLSLRASCDGGALILHRRLSARR